MHLAGNTQHPLVWRQQPDARQRHLQKAFIAGNRHELFGGIMPTERPKASTDPAAKNDGEKMPMSMADRFSHRVPFAGCAKGAPDPEQLVLRRLRTLPHSA